MTLTIHMMTAALAQGDAIGNYILALSRILREWGCEVRLYADHPNGNYPLAHLPCHTYNPTGQDILWMHFSISTDNLHWIKNSPDFVLLDSHHVSPARFFHGYDPLMESLCEQGERLLDMFMHNVDLCVAHTNYVRNDLRYRGYRRIHKLPLIVDTSRFAGIGAPQWETLLPHLDYLLFVGRVTPQKNLKFSLHVFAALLQQRPQMKYFIVGNTNLARYAHELEDLAAELSISDAVVFVGPVSEPEILTSFFRHARFYLCLSEWESFCVPIVESLHFGTPVLGHAVPPIPETMGPGGCVLTGSAAEMAQQIDALCDDTQAYQQLQQHGQAHALLFTDHQLQARLLELFHDLTTWG
jgi:glycosyltransferase involved in cell wall biosynthesis